MPVNKQRRANPRCAMAYAHLLGPLTGIAQEHGYCLAVHGSMSTDLDILLVPWTAEAAEGAQVVEAIVTTVGGFVRDGSEVIDAEAFNAHLHLTLKPHHRLAYAVYFDRASAKRGRGPYLDISVMPRKP